MIKKRPVVRIVKNWIAPDLLRQTPAGSGIWDNVEFTMDPIEECDYLLILNFAKHDFKIKCPAHNIWAMMQEPYLPGIFDWMSEQHGQFAKIFTHYIFNNDKRYARTPTCLPWHVNKNYDQLLAQRIPEKNMAISWITSNKRIFPGHKKRMEFFDRIKEEDSLNMDLFGMGIKEINDKWDALAPYKYSLAVENSNSPDYWTEKLADCFLAYTLPIYYGCANIEKYFPEKSFVKIDINNYQKSVEIIKEVLAEDIWDERLQYIREARELVLNKYQLFPFLSEKINSMESKATIQRPGSLKKPTKENIVIGRYEKKRGKIDMAIKTVDRKIEISVVVCTYNRAGLLPDCLTALQNQTLDDDLYEIIIINNNSTDNTDQVARDFINKINNFRLINEKRQGLSNARNSGVKRAKGDYLAFIDDDSIADKDWLKNAMTIAKEKKPDIFGGPVYPMYNVEKPAWFKDQYVIRGYMGETGWLEKGFIIGTNIFFKKGLIEQYGGFDPELGMKGDDIGYHEETLLVNRAFNEKKKVYYSNDLMVKDLIDDFKLTDAFYIYSKYKAGKDGLKVWNKNFDIKSLYSLFDTIDKTMKEFDNAFKKRDRDKYEYPENYIMEHIKNKFFAIGEGVEFFGDRKRLGQLLLDSIFEENSMGAIAERIVKEKKVFNMIKKLVFHSLKNIRTARGF